MPRFEPALDDSVADAVNLLIDHALGGDVLEEARLSPSSKIQLHLLRLLLADGIGIAELRNELAQPLVGADARHEAFLHKYVDELSLESTRVLCVSTDSNNDRLWEVYASAGTGAVLELVHIPEMSTPLLGAKRVAYSQQPPVVGSGIDFHLYGASADVRRKALDAIIYTKRQEWDYQNEWRAVTWRPNEGNQLYADYRFYPEELSAVTIGLHADAAFTTAVTELIADRYPHAVLRRASA